jgi:hypothetical protein
MSDNSTRRAIGSRLAGRVAAGALLAGENWRQWWKHQVFPGLVLSVLVTLRLVSVAGAALPVSLLVPQGTAFSYLRHACGGIQEQIYATGWDVSGYPTGAAHLSTRCGGSGRGGGYHATTYAAWIAVRWDFQAGVRATAALTGTQEVNRTFSATDANGDRLYNSSAHAYLVVQPPGKPAVAGVVQVGDQFQVSWTTPLENPLVITSSTITAAPVNSSAPTLVATVGGAAMAGLIGPLQPSTRYQISIVTQDAGGSSTPARPYPASSRAASMLPSAPTRVTAHWTAPGLPHDMLVVTWQAAAPGDSPVDHYRTTITGGDGGGTFEQIVSAASLAAIFSVSDIPDWRITVQAHNAVGWGPASTAIVLGGA